MKANHKDKFHVKLIPVHPLIVAYHVQDPGPDSTVLMEQSCVCSYPDWEPYPTTYLNETSPEPGIRERQKPVPYWSQEDVKPFHDKDTKIHKPRVDVLETISAFHIIVELPGLTTAADLTLKWLSARDVLVSCDIRRKAVAEHGETEVDVETLIDDDLEVVSRPFASDSQKAGAQIPKQNGVGPRTTDSVDSASAPAQQESKHTTSPNLTIAERNVGLNTRAFNFPVDVDRVHTRASLNAGLLTLEVPKKPH